MSEALPTCDDDIRRLLCYLACAVIAGGATVTDAEADIRALGRHLGCPDLQAALTPTSVWVSLAPGSPASVETISGPMRLDQSVEVAAVRHELMQGRLSIAQAVARLAQIRRKPHSYGLWAAFVGNAVVAMGICLIMQPGLANVVVTGCCSLMVTALIVLSSRNSLLAALLPTIAALLSSLVVFSLAQHGLLSGPLRTVLCPIAILLPGATLATGMGELAQGAMVSGTARSFHGSVQLLLHALGAVTAALLLGMPLSELTNTRLDAPAWLAVIGVAGIAVGVVMSESLPIRLLASVAPVLLLTYAAQAWGQWQWPTQPAAGGFAGAVVAAFLATTAEVYQRVPRLVVFLPSFWLLVPGTLGLLGITQLGAGTGQSQGIISVIVLIAAIALGLLVGQALALPLQRLARLKWRLARPRSDRSAPSSSPAAADRSDRRP